jgi:hypothetical protein
MPDITAPRELKAIRAIAEAADQGSPLTLACLRLLNDVDELKRRLDFLTPRTCPWCRHHKQRKSARRCGKCRSVRAETGEGMMAPTHWEPKED